jgi:putative DNA methylase
MTYKPKLIEVALPLLDINEESRKQKMMGAAAHPQSLHRWWARRPLAATRAVIWSSLVDDPSGDDSLTPEQQKAERDRLFGILRRLVLWGNSNDADVLAEAKAEIDRCFDGDPPPILDPFGGGGAIPLEAQRLGLTALSGDLNPIAVLIQKAMLEIPPTFSGRPPVNSTIDQGLTSWPRATGLAADVEAYGHWLKVEAKRRIGHLYPDATGPDGEKLAPIAWIWARTVESPDPSWSGHVPLVASWKLVNKKGKTSVWIEPIVDRENQTISYEIRTGGTPALDETVDRGGGFCIATGAAIPFTYIREEGQNGRLGCTLMAVVAEGKRGRTYCSGTPADLVDVPEVNLSLGRIHANKRDFKTPNYGIESWEQLFTTRQLTALTTFSDLLGEVRERVVNDAAASGVERGDPLRSGGTGAEAYADAVLTYLAFVVDKCAEHWCTICSWHSGNQQLRNAFGRQALPMTWDYCEANPFSGRMASWDSQLPGVVRAIRDCLAPVGARAGVAVQLDARANVLRHQGAVISTDPPYYDNISYADLSDFFYVWLRRNLADVWPDELSTLATPKAQEMIANQYRAGSKAAAEQHFESGMAEFMTALAESQNSNVPATIYYAYKATETKDGEVRSTGWDTFLQSVVDAGIQVTATWPMRTELGNRLIASGSNALASSIVLACRPRAGSAQMASRGEFVAALRDELPEAVRTLQSGNIAPVDIPQSTIGPGIGVFSRYSKVVESDGSAMRVSDALAIINDVLGEVLDGEEAEMDRDSRFALSWYAQYGYQDGNSGEAIGLAQAKNTSLNGVVEAGIGDTRGGKFRLFRRNELSEGWSPVDDDRRTVWESTQYLIAALGRSESEAAELLHLLGGYGENARQLAYLLFKKATDKKWTDEASAYNGLIAAWPALRAADVTVSSATPQLDYGD